MAKGQPHLHITYIIITLHIYIYTHSSLHLPNFRARFNPRWMLHKEALCWLALLHYHSAATLGYLGSYVCPLPLSQYPSNRTSVGEMNSSL